MDTMTKGWLGVMDNTRRASGIAWDGCHKIYILMDENQVSLMREYEYEHLYTNTELNDTELYEKVLDWYKNSCGLRFVCAVETMDNPNGGFTTLVEQFYE